jgi:hypothetical protein
VNSFRVVPAVVLTALFSAAPVTPGRAAGEEHAAPPAAIGLWAGSSTCVGDRPACKNESVVYRIVPVGDGATAKVRLYGDKILDGKRVPMGALDFVVSGARLSCDFTVGSTHGLWEFTVAGDTMEGTLVMLPGRDLGRRVAVRRVTEDKVPPPPPLDDYGPPLGRP